MIRALILAAVAALGATPGPLVGLLPQPGARAAAAASWEPTAEWRPNGGGWHLEAKGSRWVEVENLRLRWVLERRNEGWVRLTDLDLGGEARMVYQRKNRHSRGVIFGLYWPAGCKEHVEAMPEATYPPGICTERTIAIHTWWDVGRSWYTAETGGGGTSARTIARVSGTELQMWIYIYDGSGELLQLGQWVGNVFPEAIEVPQDLERPGDV